MTQTHEPMARGAVRPTERAENARTRVLSHENGREQDRQTTFRKQDVPLRRSFPHTAVTAPDGTPVDLLSTARPLWRTEAARWPAAAAAADLAHAAPLPQRVRAAVLLRARRARVAPATHVARFSREPTPREEGDW